MNPQLNTPHEHALGAERVPRRAFLRGLGVCLALPWLEQTSAAISRANPEPRRMLLISNNLGVLPKPFFPKAAGDGYELSPYLAELADFQNDFSVFSGLSHPDVAGGHSTENCFLTGARGPTKSGFRNTISLDQFAADALGPVTRFPTLNLGVNIDKANRSLSWTRDGALLPAQDSATALFTQLFSQGDPKSIARQQEKLRVRGSILDALRDDANQFGRHLGGGDKARLEQYLNSIREVEQRLQSARRWATRPRPKPLRSAPDEIHDKKRFFEKFELMLSMAQLALQTDSTRIVTLMVDAFATPVFQLHENQKTTDGYHNLSHHGQSPAKLKQLEDADRQQMALLKRLFQFLADQQVAEERLLDNTMVLFGSNMGNSNTHDNTNLPILLAGGGFQHGRHLRFDQENNKPLCSLFVSMLQRLGLETEQFSSSDGPLSELAMKS